MVLATESDTLNLQAETDIYVTDYLNEDTGESDAEEPIYTDYSVTKLTVTEAGSYWLTGYDAIGKKAGIAYPNCTEIDATECTGDVVLVGNAKSNLLLAGSGKSSLWGGIDGNDTMQGGIAQDMFWFGEGDGKDVVRDFTTGSGEAADVLVLYRGPLKSVTRNGMVLTVNMAESNRLTVNTDSLGDGTVLYTWDGKTNLQAKIGNAAGDNRLTYEEDVSYYQGGNFKDTLVLSGGTEAKIVWLDGSQKKTFSGIEIIDGSESSGADQLAGTYAAESIVGGRAEASLWGGQGSADDTLRAGTGDNLLYYGYAEGNDLIQSTYRDAKVMLYNMSLSQIAETKIGGNVISIATTSGHTLTVEGKTAYFALADGTKWKPNRQDGVWVRI